MRVCSHTGGLINFEPINPIKASAMTLVENKKQVLEFTLLDQQLRDDKIASARLRKSKTKKRKTTRRASTQSGPFGNLDF